MYCKNIRNDKHPEENPQGWARVEDYVESHTDATFSHGISPDCYEPQVKPEMEQLLSNKAE